MVIDSDYAEILRLLFSYPQGHGEQTHRDTTHTETHNIYIFYCGFFGEKEGKP